MNVLQITEFPVVPPASGGDHRKHGLVHAFPSFGDTVYRFSQGVPVSEYGGQFAERVPVSHRYTEVRYRNPLLAWHQVTAAFDVPYVFASAPIRIWDPPPLRSLRRWADLIVVEEPWQFPAIAERAEDTPLVLSSHNAEAHKFANAPSKSVADRLALPCIRWIERRSVTLADAIVVPREAERERLHADYGIECPVIVAPNATYRRYVEDARDRTGAARAVREEHDIDPAAFVGLFVGSAYGPNVDAASNVLNVAAALDRDEVDFHAIVVGSACRALSRSPPNVTLAGFVDEIEPYYDAADVALNPVEWGGGTNVKVFDYFARRLPVVSTPFGVRGIDVEDGEHVVLAHVRDFPDELRRLAADETRRSRIGAEARRFVGAHHVWEQVSADLRERLFELWSDRWNA